jgi:hypothetical protein
MHSRLPLSGAHVGSRGAYAAVKSSKTPSSPPLLRPRLVRQLLDELLPLPDRLDF